MHAKFFLGPQDGAEMEIRVPFETVTFTRLFDRQGDPRDKLVDIYMLVPDWSDEYLHYDYHSTERVYK